MFMFSLTRVKKVNPRKSDLIDAWENAFGFGDFGNDNLLGR